VEHEYCGKLKLLPVTKSENTLNDNLSSSAMASRSGHSSYDPYGLSSDEEEYLVANNMAETTPGQCDCVAC
jgi:hypothetical protein